MELRNAAPDELGRLALLAKIGAMFNRSYDIDEVLRRVLDVVIETLQAERGFIMLDYGADEHEIAVSHGMNLSENAPHPYSRTVVEQVLHSGEPILSNDVPNDARWQVSKSLNELRTQSIMCVPLHTPERNVGLIYLDHHDVSELFRPTDLDLLKIIASLAAAAIERALYFSRLMQREKLVALGHLVAGVVHELNNPLTSIIGFAQLQQLQGGCDACNENAPLILAEGQRCKKLISDLLGLSRDKKTAMREFDVGAVISRALRLMGQNLSHDRISVLCEGADTLPPMYGDPDQILQLLLNLLDNARRAVLGQNEPTVAVRASAQDAVLQIRVSDNGPGVAAHSVGRIFDPFFSTRAPGEGTGLGLSIVARIVADHGGHVQVHNRPGGGAAFVVELPLRDGVTS